MEGTQRGRELGGAGPWLGILGCVWVSSNPAPRPPKWRCGAACPESLGALLSLFSACEQERA